LCFSCLEWIKHLFTRVAEVTISTTGSLTTMPESNDSGKRLRGGEFYSPLQARLRTDDVLLSELR
jgi:hypothetical protein